ncbi:MAG TPA: RNA polymerase sigma factor [Candidatus Dojkabacteria bacterium]|nr:RNA polymerase sigma factor [Candidatus Dojkabacteria bacterium]
MKRGLDEKKIQILSDKEIVNMTIKDFNSYRYIIDRYEKRLLRYIQRILYISKEDAEDILQEVFIKAYKNINGYDSKYSFSSWIYRIAHNEAISFLRKQKRSIESSNDMDIFDTLPSDESIEDNFLVELRKKEVRKILKMLEPKYREPLILRYFEDMEYNEISDILHISIGNVSSLINRGKKKFKVLVQRYGKNI